MTVWWFVAFLLFLIIEVLTINLVSIWFALAALICMIVSIFTDSLIIQLIVFIISSIIFIILTRPILKRFNIANFEATNLDRVVGSIGDAISDINVGEVGQVKVLGKVWTAMCCENIKKGKKVKVLQIKGVKLLVEEVR